MIAESCRGFAELQERGVIVLRGFFASRVLMHLRECAERCFAAIKAGAVLEGCRLSASSNSVLMRALLDFGCESEDELLGPLVSPELEQLVTSALGRSGFCNLEQSWLRKKFALPNTPNREYHLQNWHQDGALGAEFPPEPGPVIPMRELVTCWIPLQDCGRDAPGLEFVRLRQPALLHFRELQDTALRQRFKPEEFWAPALEFGDGLLFLNDVLHRTHVCERMREDRLSIEYRIFPNRS